DRAPAIWQQLCESGGFHECGSSFWRRHEILSGIPTVTSETSEEFVPQMLNLDLLGGISLNKGCYTGQEIVARMYYLGRLKRRMFLIRCPAFTKPGTAIFDAENDSRQSIGTVVQVTFAGEPCYALAVLQISHASTKLRLDSPRGEPICVAEQPYPHPGSADNAPGT
ncbi:MAG: tRNA-modifying protein YgfZ, partial [Pseudomonadota bacterium]